MAERLQQISGQADPRNHYASAARLDAMRAAEPSADPRRRLMVRGGIGQELLHLGRIEEAIGQFESLLAEVASYGQALEGEEGVHANFVMAIRESLAAAHLKKAELENCVARRSSRNCLVPIEEGVPEVGHVRSAVAEYEWLLRVEPGNRTNRWLLNLAWMMMGDYPEGVAAQWLIPPDAFRSEYDVGRFPEIASDLELDVNGHAGGSIMDDFDGDGDLDLVASSWDLRDQLLLFVNDGDGRFSERSAEAGLAGIVGGLNLVQADYDNDGFLDILVLRGAWQPVGQPNSLLRNNGDGTFEDVTEAAGLLDAHSTQTAAWGDYDSDGWIDLYVGNESSGGREDPNQLFRNDGDGTFTDVAAETGTAVIGYVKAVVWGDIDNDGRPDLFISRINEPNVLLHNDGPDAAGAWSFSDVTAQAGVAEPNPSFPAWFWDYDNDGWLDIFVAGYRAVPGDMAAEYLGLAHRADLPRLYRNDGDGTFSDVTAAARLDRIIYAMGSNYGDLDNDGYLDFYAGTGDPDFRLTVPNRMFRNTGEGFFQDVTTSGGFGHMGKGHGVSFGDLDDDGDQDIYATMGGMMEGDVARNVLFENPGHGNHWITLRLEGVRSNRAAIGARIKVTVETGQGPRDIYATVSSGGSFGANSLQCEIGLGQATAVETVEITWPATGIIDTYANVEMDRTYRLREGDAVMIPVR